LHKIVTADQFLRGAWQMSAEHYSKKICGGGCDPDNCHGTADLPIPATGTKLLAAVV